MKIFNPNLQKHLRLFFTIFIIYSFGQISQAQNTSDYYDQVEVTLGSMPSFGNFDGTFFRGGAYQSCNCWHRTDFKYSIGRVDKQWLVFKNAGCPLTLVPDMPIAYGYITTTEDCDITDINGVAAITSTTRVFVSSSNGQNIQPNQNDKNNGILRGSISHPFATIQFALDNSSSGTTITVRAGTYKENLTWKEDNITLTNYRDAEKTEEIVYLDGDFSGNTGTLIDVVGKQNVNIRNLVIRNSIKASYVGNAHQSPAKGISVTGSASQTNSGINIIGCKITNIGYQSWGNRSRLPTSNDNAHPIHIVGNYPLEEVNIIGNEIHNCITGYSESLTVKGNVDGFLVSDNYVHDNTNIGIDIAGYYDGSDNAARNGSVNYNRVINCFLEGIDTPAGIYIDGAQNVTIEGNESSGNGAGFSIGLEKKFLSNGTTPDNRNLTVSDIVIKNNFAHGNIGPAIYFGTNYAYYDVKSCEIIKNLFFQNNTKPNSIAPEIFLQKTSDCDITKNVIVMDNDQCIGIGSFGQNFSNLSHTLNKYYRVNDEVFCEPDDVPVTDPPTYPTTGTNSVVEKSNRGTTTDKIPTQEAIIGPIQSVNYYKGIHLRLLRS